MVKSGAGTQDSVNAASYLDVMHTYNIALDKKEISKINKAILYIIIAFIWCQDQGLGHFFWVQHTFLIQLILTWFSSNIYQIK